MDAVTCTEDTKPDCSRMIRDQTDQDGRCANTGSPRRELLDRALRLEARERGSREIKERKVRRLNESLDRLVREVREQIRRKNAARNDEQTSPVMRPQQSADRVIDMNLAHERLTPHPDTCYPEQTSHSKCWPHTKHTSGYQHYTQTHTETHLQKYIRTYNMHYTHTNHDRQLDARPQPRIFKDYLCSTGAVEKDVGPLGCLQRWWEKYPVENRLFMTVRIGDEEFRALIDTGATRSFVGPRVSERIGPYIMEQAGSVQVADGMAARTSGCAVIRFSSENRTCILPVGTAPVLAHEIILGMDFVTEMNVRIEGGNITWGDKTSLEAPEASGKQLTVTAKPLRIESMTEADEDKRVNHVPPQNSPFHRQQAKNKSGKVEGPQDRKSSTQSTQHSVRNHSKTELGKRVAADVAQVAAVNSSRVSTSSGPIKSSLAGRCPESCKQTTKKEETHTAKQSFGSARTSLGQKQAPRHRPNRTFVAGLHRRGEGTCWRCGGRGHTHRECASPRQWSYCYMCGEKDVMISTCSQCSEAWRRTKRRSARPPDPSLRRLRASP